MPLPHPTAPKRMVVVRRPPQVAVSVFVMDKEDPLIRGLAKTQKEALLEAFRREIATLKQFAQAKPMPCPSVLRLFQARS